MGEKLPLPVRTGMMLAGILLIGVSVALYRLAAFGVDPFTGMNLGISTFLGWSFGNWQLPVSYTHLDVYKRQVLSRQQGGNQTMKAKRRAAGVAKVLAGAVLLVVALFPIYWLVAMSIRETGEMQGQIPLLPQSLTFEHFANLFLNEGFGQATLNSLQTTLSSLVLSLIVGVCAAYVIARRRFQFKLKKPLTYWILLVRVLPPVAFTIPLYTMFSKIGLLNTKIPVTLACVLILSLIHISFQRRIFSL